MSTIRQNSDDLTKEIYLLDLFCKEMSKKSEHEWFAYKHSFTNKYYFDATFRVNLGSAKYPKAEDIASGSFATTKAKLSNGEYEEIPIIRDTSCGEVKCYRDKNFGFLSRFKYIMLQSNCKAGKIPGYFIFKFFDREHGLNKHRWGYYQIFDENGKDENVLKCDKSPLSGTQSGRVINPDDTGESGHKYHLFERPEAYVGHPKPEFFDFPKDCPIKW